MAAKRSKSKKQSAASCRQKQPDEVVFFLDRCLGRIVVADAMRAAGESVQLHHDHFDQNAADHEWLMAVGRRGWVVLTKDRNIKSNQIEIVSLINADIACFNLVSASLDGPQMAAAFVAALPNMKRMLKRIERPFVANVTKSGSVDLICRYADLAKRI